MALRHPIDPHLALAIFNGISRPIPLLDHVSDDVEQLEYR